MTRIVVIPSGITSTLHTDLALGRRLARHGHDVVVVGPIDVAATVAGHGVDVVGLHADRDAFAEIADTLAGVRRGDVRSRIRSAVRLVGVIRKGRRATVGASELLAALDAIGPDLVLVDHEAHVAIVACRGQGVPMALTTAYFALEPNEGVPPIDSWLTPEDGADALAADWRRVHRASDRVRRRAWTTRRRIVDLIGPVSLRSSSPTALAAVARHTGTDLASFTDRSQWIRPWGYRGVPVLTTNLRELEFGAGGSENWEYLGPMVDPERPDRALGDGDRAALDAVVERCEGDPARRLVYCSLGSYWRTDARLLSAVVEVFRRRPEWELVIGLGATGRPDQLGELPDNVLALGWAPQVRLLRSADAAIVHGGNATLNECVASGVPMVVCSTGHLDQNGVSSRVAYAGIGLATSGRSASADWIDSALSEVLTDPGYRDRVRELAATAADPGTAGRAVEVIDRLVGA